MLIDCSNINFFLIWEHQESNPRWLGGKRKRYLCSMKSPTSPESVCFKNPSSSCHKLHKCSTLTNRSFLLYLTLDNLSVVRDVFGSLPEISEPLNSLCRFRRQRRRRSTHRGPRRHPRRRHHSSCYHSVIVVAMAWRRRG